MNQKQKTMLKRIVAAAIVYIAAAAAKKMNVFAGMPQPWTCLLYTSRGYFQRPDEKVPEVRP